MLIVVHFCQSVVILTGSQVYDQNFEHALLELGMDARGVAVAANWEVNTNALRTWLRKLRGICTHPQVGQLQGLGSNDKGHKSGVLKTMSEVLEVTKYSDLSLHPADSKT